MPNERHTRERVPARIRGLIRNTRGIASIEFAVIVSLIIVTVLAIHDIGSFLLQEMKLAEAAEAAGQSAISYPPLDTASIPSDQSVGLNAYYMTQAIQAALPQGWTDVQVTSQWNCTQACSERILTITLTRPFSPLLLAVASLESTSATYVARVQ